MLHKKVVTVKRSVDNDEQRYGGYKDSNYVDVGYDLETNRSYSEAQNAQGEYGTHLYQDRHTDPIKYSSRTSFAPERQVGSPMPSSPKKHQRIEDVMPGIAKKPANAPDFKTEEQFVIKHKMETRTKAMLAIYLFVVLALAAIVIATGVAISSASARVSSLNQEISERNSYLLEQNVRLELLNDEDAIRGKATVNGMTQAENITEIDLLPLDENTTYERSTNWFDRFCRFLSRIFGG